MRMALLALLVASLACGSASDPADLILENGRIITVDRDFTIASAMAIKNGKIVATGQVDDIGVYRGPRTRLIDLGGKTVLPGLIDSHSHAASASIIEFDHPVPNMETIEEVLEYIRSRAAALKDGEWIKVSQVFLTRLEEQRYPTRDELDAAAPLNPVIFETGPDASVSSLALEMSGIDEQWEVVDGGPGFVEKDPKTGRLTGILRGCTRYLKYQPPFPAPPPEEHSRLLRQLIRDYNRIGITSIAERWASSDEITLYRKLERQGELTARVYISQRLDAQKPIREIRAQLQAMAASPLFDKEGLVRVAAVKTFVDGGMLTGSAYMRHPWGVSRLYGISDPEYRGLLFITPEKLRQILIACFETDIQFTAHAVGDGAVHTFIDACEDLSDRFELSTRRPVICHANFMSEEAISDVARLGIGVDIQPAWLYLDGRTLRQQFGDERLRWFQPLRSLFEAGAVAGGGSDHMQKIGSRRSINFYDPWLAMWVASTRKARWLEDPIRPEQALSRPQLIQFYTINNARLLQAEDNRGSLEPDKWADFIVISDDLLSCPTEKLRDIEVEQTFLAGKLVYSRD